MQLTCDNTLLPQQTYIINFVLLLSLLFGFFNWLKSGLYFEKTIDCHVLSFYTGEPHHITAIKDSKVSVVVCIPTQALCPAWDHVYINRVTVTVYLHILLHPLVLLV